MSESLELNWRALVLAVILACTVGAESPKPPKIQDEALPDWTMISKARAPKSYKDVQPLSDGTVAGRRLAMDRC